MPATLTRRSICLAVMLIGLGEGAHALVIGQLNGPAVIGRALDLTASLQFDNAQETAQPCLSAEVFYGETKLAAGSVRVSVVAAARGRPAYARIQSATVVNEPVVTVALRGGCARVAERGGVVLADAPGTFTPTSIAAAAPVMAAAREKPNLPPANGAVRTRTAAAARSERPDTRVNSSRGWDRLTLPAREPISERAPWLRVSSELAGAPTANPAQRVAAAALWRALASQPYDRVRTLQRLDGLETDIASLRGIATRQRAEAVDVRAEMQRAGTLRYTNYALGGLLLLLAAAGAVLFWRRGYRESMPVDAWWDRATDPSLGKSHSSAQAQPSGAKQREDAERFLVSQPVPDHAAAPMRPDKRVVPGPGASPLVAPLEFDAPSLGPGGAVPDAVRGEPDSPRMLKVEALHAAQQQADFFASLGQGDEAIEVLTAYIHESEQPAGLAYLELFRFYRTLGMRREFSQLQAEYSTRFGVKAAHFDAWKYDMRDLDEFPVALERVCASWPSPEGLVVIEELLFDSRGTDPQALSAPAWRELVWLYGLQLEMVGRSKSAHPQRHAEHSEAGENFLLPWAFEEDDEPEPPLLTVEHLSRIDVAPASAAFGVDIDLSGPTSDAVLEKERESVALQNAAHALSLIAPGSPAAAQPAQDSSADLFDAVMEADSRRYAKR